MELVTAMEVLVAHLHSDHTALQQEEVVEFMETLVLTQEVKEVKVQEVMLIFKGEMVVLVRITQELVLNMRHLGVLEELHIGEEAEDHTVIPIHLNLVEPMVPVEVLHIMIITIQEQPEKPVSYTWSSTPNGKESTYFK